MEVKYSMDTVGYNAKPCKQEMGLISSRIAKKVIVTETSELARMFFGGKYIIECNPKIFFTLEDLVITLQTCMHDREKGNYSRKSKKFSRKFYIAVEGCGLAVFDA